MGTKNWSTPRLWIGVDPGQDTGMSMIVTTDMQSPPKLVQYITRAYNPLAIHSTLKQWYHFPYIPPGTPTQDFLTLIVEKFTPRPGRPYNHTALRVMGVCESWYQLQEQQTEDQIEYIERTPVQGKNEVSDLELDRLGMLLTMRKNRHINDSTRHIVSVLLERGHMGTALVAKPKDEDE